MGKRVTPCLTPSRTDSPANECCAVCLGQFEEGDEVRMLLPCTHEFHKGCIDEWLLVAPANDVYTLP